MNTTFIEFKKSVFDPNFYKEIPNLSGKHILNYVWNFALALGIIATIISAIYLYFSVGQGEVSTSAYIVASIFGGLSVGVLTVIMTVIGLLVYSIILAGIVLLISVFLKRQITYKAAYKYSIYAVSLPIIIGVPVQALPGLIGYTLSIQIILFILIFGINFKKSALK